MSLDRQITHQNRFREKRLWCLQVTERWTALIYTWARDQESLLSWQQTQSRTQRDNRTAPFVNIVLLDSGFMWHTSLFVICLWGPKCFHPFLVPSPGVSWERISPSVWSLLTCLSQIHLDFVYMGVCGFDSILYEWAVSLNTKVNWSPWKIFDSISFRSDKTRQP